ncbi:unnamed protein product, partial [Ectocarpus sp. 13 AM-2016]
MSSSDEKSSTCPDVLLDMVGIACATERWWLWKSGGGRGSGRRWRGCVARSEGGGTEKRKKTCHCSEPGASPVHDIDEGCNGGMTEGDFFVKYVLREQETGCQPFRP